MMKYLLCFSLLLNVILATLYYQEKSRPPLERIILEEKKAGIEASPSTQKMVVEAREKKSKVSKQTEGEDSEVDPLEVFSAEDFELIADDMNEIRKDFHAKLGLSEDLLRKKEKIMQEYLKESAPIYAKSPLPFNLSFADRRKLIDLEEKLHKDFEQLYGKENWARYKAKVDSYNKKVLEGHIRGENSSVMMNY